MRPQWAKPSIVVAGSAFGNGHSEPIAVEKEAQMTWTHGYAVAGVLAMNLLAAAAQSAPLANTESAIAPDRFLHGIIANTGYRRCWQHDGHRHCHWYQNAYPSYADRGDDERAAGEPTYGSAAWWRKMLREDRVRN
jgi:hypothetical protein